MGVRMALGARPLDVVALVTRQGMRLVIRGLVLGLALALAGGRLVASLLYQVAPSDPPAYIAAGALLVVVGAMMGTFLEFLGGVLRQIAPYS